MILGSECSFFTKHKREHGEAAVKRYLDGLRHDGFTKRSYDYGADYFTVFEFARFGFLPRAFFLPFRSSSFDLFRHAVSTLDWVFDIETPRRCFLVCSLGVGGVGVLKTSSYIGNY